MLTQQARELVIKTVMNVNPALITAIAVGRAGAEAGGSHNRDAILRIKAISFQRKGSREISGKNSVHSALMAQITRQTIRSLIL
jgi:hypothetical protein